ncbi:MAG: formate dehydrogenase accessory sulfurtransferase FdhD [Sedimentisphaerales bacterium]|nr:formate dehydrogenase accessory sulfurtransferase FdhD [Sedimentisphaerales bacterium]
MANDDLDNIINLDVNCVSLPDGQLIPEQREVVKEEPLTLDIKDVGTYTLMCTPSDAMALAVGFAFTEGLLTKRDDINVIMKCPDDPGVIRMQLAHPETAKAGRRNLLIISSCGICGSEDIDKVINALPVAGDQLRISMQDLLRMPQLLKDKQAVFHRTGGTHAVALMQGARIVALGEDIGRHNAFDKAIGSCILQQIPTQHLAAALSGRVSFEMTTKAASAGIELIAAVSAPTTLAIKTAQKTNITLAAFVRNQNATIYTHPHRIIP